MIYFMIERYFFFRQEGALGRQSFAAMMITIAIGLAMVHLMMMFGNFVATRLLPKRNLYRRYTEEEIAAEVFIFLYVCIYIRPHTRGYQSYPPPLPHSF